VILAKDKSKLRTKKENHLAS